MLCFKYIQWMGAGVIGLNGKTLTNVPNHVEQELRPKAERERVTTQLRNMAANRVQGRQPRWKQWTAIKMLVGVGDISY